MNLAFLPQKVGISSLHTRVIIIYMYNYCFVDDYCKVDVVYIVPVFYGEDCWCEHRCHSQDQAS